ncbi:hypothetical protein AC623_20600 [Bacillus sp. FJAT-27231]|uniref:DUF4062 domain-containing protein n=1 Tax=Bacillus sp. FJAT-27231 TaxID=1679168 RepID=UPI00067150E0|nr:DUF4062 domain-containing protein [Bacillus sp. FJAT-27231]KMY52538.1 hypothetical protein AC623_20600 [Bacillus sp. FJAT-27231]
MDKKYQVFISSTYIDLKEARRKVLETILDLQQFPAGMEVFPAGDDDQWTHIRSVIDKSDYYVLILGHRYGSLAPDGIGYTEKEYDYAREKGIPVLAFIRDRDVATQTFERESSAEIQEKLDKFVDKAKANKLCRFWSNPEDLANKVSTSLATSFSTHPRVGWVRGDQAASPKVAEELAVLNKENRALQAELEQFKSQANKGPLFEVKLNDKESIELVYKKDLRLHSIPIPREVMMPDIPDHLLEFVTGDDIVNFNASIEKDTEKIEKYNKELKLNGAVDLMGLDIAVSLYNKGEAKGNGIYVDIEFPDSVLVLEGVKEDFPYPSKPAVTENPWMKAERLYQKKINGDLGAGGVASLLNNWPHVSGFIEPNNRLNSKLLKGLSRSNQNLISWLDDNIITIRCKELLHTRYRDCVEDYILVPKEPGECEIKVSIICEEYTKKDEIIIPLIIREE